MLTQINKKIYYFLLLLLIFSPILFFSDIIYAENNQWDIQYNVNRNGQDVPWGGGGVGEITKVHIGN